MAADIQPAPDRRRHPRVQHPSVILLFTEGEAQGRYLGRYAIENLSAGGALVTGAPPLEAGDRVRALLLPAGHDPEPLSAEVVRVEPRPFGAALGLQFDGPLGLPLVPGQAAAEPPVQGKGRVVLVVDDDPAVRRALVRDLSVLGCDVLAAASPLEAVNVLNDSDAAVGIVIVDLCLGPSDGLDLVDWLAGERPEVRRVLMSGRVEPWQLEFASRSGLAQGWIRKPWERQDLVRAVRHRAA